MSNDKINLLAPGSLSNNVLPSKNHFDILNAYKINFLSMIQSKNLLEGD